MKYPEPAIKDIYCKGINPLRCVVCQEKKKLEGKMTCGDVDCKHRYFAERVKPDTSEKRILK